MGQTVLDVEVWANGLLCSELDTRGLSYHCLLDYDLQVVEVQVTLSCVQLLVFIVYSHCCRMTVC